MSHAAVQLFLESVERLRARLRKLKDGPVASKPFREAAQALVRDYFATTRPALASHSTDLVGALDADCQELMRFTHSRTLKSRYASLLKALATNSRELELAVMSGTGTSTVQSANGEREQLIIDTMRKIVPAAARSFEQGLMDLRSTDRVSWRGAVVEFREALREVLDHLAPDKDVQAQAGFKLEKDTHGPTMKQKVVFILKSRQKSTSDTKVSADAVIVVDEMVGGFVRSVYQRSSMATHVALGKDEANRVREYVTLALMELLEINHYGK